MVSQLRAADGRAIRYIDRGTPDQRPVVFLGGLGTSVLAFTLTEFLRTTRERLELRLIATERNGFGETPFDAGRGLDDAADDVLTVLAALGVERFALVAFSGGGPYAAAIAARVPDRVTSLHLAAAVTGAPLLAGVRRARSFSSAAAEIAADPREFWRFPPSSPVHRIPGFAAAAMAEGEYALAEPMRAALALTHELNLLHTQPLPDLRHVLAPAFVYWGSADATVGEDHAAAWQDALAGHVTPRRYPGEAHDVQYRHWDRILLDLAGHGERTLGRAGPWSQATSSTSTRGAG